MKCEEVPLVEFLKAELDAEQTEQVIAHTEECPACRERLQVMAALAASYPAQAEPVRSRRGAPRRKIWLLAAAVVIALLMPVLYFEMRETSLGDLATDAPYPAQFPLVTRDRPRSQEDEVRRQADQAYAEGDYQAAEARFQQLPPEPSTSFYLGVCQYLLKRYPEALINLTAATRDRQWKGPALWYRASTYLRLGQKQQAREDLIQLVSRKDEYGTNAAELLDELDQMR